MIDINKEIRNILGPLSLEGLKATLYYPNWYVATSIGDFLENREIVRPTPDKLFLVDRKYIGRAAVLFKNCQYTEVHERAPLEKFNWLWQIDLGYLQLIDRLGILSGEEQRELKKKVSEYHNGRISDLTGEIDICCPHDIPSASRLQRAWIVNDVKRDLFLLNEFYRHGHPARERQSSTIFDKVTTLVPEFA